MSTPNGMGSGGFQALLPGTTFAEQHPRAPSATKIPKHEPYVFSGPTIDGRKTTTTLYEPAELAASPAVPALFRLINEAFDHSHKTKGLPFNVDRLPSTAAYLSQIGTDPGTFIYIVSWSENGEPIATAGAHRYVSPVLMAEDASSQRSTFSRVQLSAAAEAEESEVWELKLMAVDVRCNGRGLASYMMKLVDEEVRRRRNAAAGSLWMVLTTVTEANAAFYKKRGYVDDYETEHGPGSLGTPNGFHVVHMSKALGP